MSIDRIDSVRLRLAVLLLLGAVSSSVVAPPASADCISDCQAEVYCDSENQWECTRKLGQCYIERCPGSGSASRKYGAIALSIDRLEYGYSYGYDSQKEAESAAIGYCRDNPSKPENCEIRVWFYDACGALALKEDPKHIDGAWGADWGRSKNLAEKKALTQCQKHAREGCKIVESFCS